MINRVGFGGGCHWCSEAIFDSLIGISKVEQGWISAKEDSSFSEAVIVEFNSNIISLEALIKIHLYTHNSTSSHKFRAKYRSAIYCFNTKQKALVEDILKEQAEHFSKPLVTKAYTFLEFKLNKKEYLNYYKNNPNRPFCKARIEPKLNILLKQFSKYYRS